MNNISLSIIIPARNERSNLPIILNGLKNKICIEDYEIIIVKAKNDDSDFDIDLNSHTKIRVIEQNINGYGAALKIGFESSTKEFLCIFNADGSFEPNDINRLLEKISENNDFVYCSRYLKNAGSEDDNLITFVGNHVFSFIGRFFFNLKLTDILFTFFVANTKKIKLLNLNSNDFAICVEMPVKMHRSNLKYTEIPSYEYKRIHGKKNVNEFKDGLLILIKMVKLFLYER